MSPVKHFRHLQQIQGKSVWRSIRFFFQRLFCGFDDSETWSLDYTIACFALPRLKRFRKINKIGYPSLLNSYEEWDEILNEIEWMFEIYATERVWALEKHELDRFVKAKALFGEWFGALWW